MIRRQFARAVFYVGPPKTGSSALETFAWRNRDALLRQGCFIPLTGVSNNQHIEFAAAFADRAPADRRARLLNQAGIAPGQIASRRRRLTAELTAEIVAAPASDTLLLLSEAFFPATPEEIDGYRGLLSAHAGRMESVMYLRRQDRWLASRSLQLRKVGGRTHTAINPGRPERYRCNVEAWFRGADCCHVRRYEPEFLAGGSLIWDFCQTIGADVAELDMTELRINPSPYQEQLELVDILNPKLETLAFAEQAQTRKRFLAAVSAMIGGTPFSVARSDALAVFNAYKPVNRWLRDTFDPGGPAHFFSEDFSDYTAAGSGDQSMYSREQLAKLLAAWAAGEGLALDRTEAVEQVVTAFLSRDAA